MWLFVIIVIVLFVSNSRAGRECEVVQFSPYESLGVELMDKRFVQVMEKCAVVTIRNTGDKARYANDYDLTAVFADGEAVTEPIDNESDRLQKIEPGKEYTTYKCFGPGPDRIIRIDCSF